MSALAVPARRPVLADALAPHRSRVLDAGLVLAGAAVVALLAQVTIPLPLVPITGQTLGVILVGAALGARRGALSMAAYLLIGLAGAPVFAEFSGGPAMLLAPSFGFALGFVPAAFVAGWFAERAWDRRPVLAMIGFVAASAVPFLVGLPYLAMIMNAVLGADAGLGAVLAAGLWPFVPGGLVKAVLAAVLIPAAWKGVRALDARR
ncbi:biotin transporter BioY [Brachybacterium aquaticum]|uniref:Biotin transporter n=1 Tax=Brachybacterium aquaticum TaxID=1432564 RepID=A0A841AAX5_9MICO|nr:biotin transporter BioY [Brachybacterium aquaticum]MBB5832359.1 biotin transport system substrate-specific component [Brachybacterium aquaticum]